VGHVPCVLCSSASPFSTPFVHRRGDAIVDLTLTVDDAVLQRARQRALEEGTSVNAQVRTFLQRYAGAGSGFEGFLALTAGLGARSGPQGRSWTREQLHERGSFADVTDPLA
jgi:4-hydroxyphenylpyruvate dioxygenase-like putative hemolysin